MNIEDVMKTAHIEIESVSMRIHVDDVEQYDFEKMNIDILQPDFLIDVSKSNDPQQNKKSFLAVVTENYDLIQLANFIEHCKK